jgi:DNA-binding transcriptional regulator LsrR (DeoR family)
MGRALRADPGVRETLRLAGDADLLVAGVGGMDRGSGLLIERLSEREQAQLDEAGAVGDISGRFFDGDGTPVTSDVDERVVGLTLGELSAIPRRVAVSFGPHKAEALRTALRAGLMNMAVTDVTTAKALLEKPDDKQHAQRARHERKGTAS